MRIETQGHSIDQVASSKSMNTTQNKELQLLSDEKILQEEDQNYSTEKLQQAVDSLNEIFEINNRQLKFVYHDGLKQYYVQLVDSQTENVVKEIPPKKLLDAFYEMQKLVGMIVDEKI
ncbi:flagellar protein FlaG [Lysinibacillus antri]|uniref:Flagellar biosynthesis protein FlaG n=1 Tax=Lysinibacillus antri TaxID=2498145 RepID=A0A432LDE8_9BACI|nr:flagellar protein FlaG [Lysinibacillus antri]RUL54203.1 flagellar biosynthesis protein FlaG [Lysinibacillus antri]